MTGKSVERVSQPACVFCTCHTIKINALAEVSSVRMKKKINISNVYNDSDTQEIKTMTNHLKNTQKFRKLRAYQNEMHFYSFCLYKKRKIITYSEK